MPGGTVGIPSVVGELVQLFCSRNCRIPLPDDGARDAVLVGKGIHSVDNLLGRQLDLIADPAAGLELLRVVGLVVYPLSAQLLQLLLEIRDCRRRAIILHGHELWIILSDEPPDGGPDSRSELLVVQDELQSIVRCHLPAASQSK